MAALDFPTPTKDGQIFKADNGVWYTWKAAGSYWSGSLGTAIGNLEGYYVNKTGDKMFGNLTLGTESPTTSIILNATSGAATFDGRLTLNGSGAGTAAYIGDNGEVQITYQGNITTAGNVGIGNFDALSGSWVSIGSETVARVVLKCTDDVGKTWSLLSGSAGQLGAYDHTNNRYGAYLSTDGNLLLGGTLPSNPNISLNADGSITAVGNVVAGNGSAGRVNAQFGTIGDTWLNYSGFDDTFAFMHLDNSNQPKASITAAGSATFAGAVQAGNLDNTQADGQGVICYPVGSVQVQRTSTTANTSHVWRGYRGSTKTSEILADGSATFAGDVVIGDIYTLTDSQGSRINSGGGFFAQKKSDNSPTASVFGGWYGSTKTFEVQADGSAIFAGRVMQGDPLNSTTNNRWGTLISYGGSRTANEARGSVVISAQAGSDANSSALQLNRAGSKPFVVLYSGEATFADKVTADKFVTDSAAISGGSSTSSASAKAGFYMVRTANDTINAWRLFNRQANTTASFGIFSSTSGTETPLSKLTLAANGDIRAGSNTGSGATTGFTLTAATGDATFKGTVQQNGTRSGSIQILLEADDDTKYTTTTDADGNETRVYNGATLDVKDRLTKLDTALTGLKAALVSTTDHASLKAALIAALADI